MKETFVMADAANPSSHILCKGLKWTHREVQGLEPGDLSGFKAQTLAIKPLTWSTPSLWKTNKRADICPYFGLGPSLSEIGLIVAQGSRAWPTRRRPSPTHREDNLPPVA